MKDGPEALEGIADVSRETIERLEKFVALLRKWQPAENLIAPSTMAEIWRRHIADSAQVPELFPGLRWIDLGSGGGFPGLVIAILGAPQVYLVESNGRKCAFLRAAGRETAVRVAVCQGRIETVLANWQEPVDRIAARALAGLSELLRLSEPLMRQGMPAAFMKGVGYQAEVDEARREWDFDLTVHPSKVEEGAAILDVRNARRKPNQDKTRA